MHEGEVHHGSGPCGQKMLLHTYHRVNSVYEHTGEVRLEIFRTLLSISANRDYHLGLPKEGGRGKYYSFSLFLVCQSEEEGNVDGVTATDIGAPA